MGAANAFTGEAGKGKNVLTGETGRAFSQTAGYYRDAGLRLGRNRRRQLRRGKQPRARRPLPQAPRRRGRHSPQLRPHPRVQPQKAGPPPPHLSRTQPHYDLIREDDRISLTNLANLAPNKPVLCTIHHTDGSTDAIHLDHSMAANQIPWFQAGSALNMLAG